MQKIKYNLLKYDGITKYKDIFILNNCYENIKNELPSYYKKFIFLELYEYFFHTNKKLLFIGCEWINDFLALIFYQIDLNDQSKNQFATFEQILANNYILKSKENIENINFNSNNEPFIIENNLNIDISIIKANIKEIYKY